MSVKPRIFVSAVTSEFGRTRQAAANILSRLGYDPVLQDIFGTEPGDLRQMLRDKIDDCDGLIQIVGDAYGAEPPEADEQFGRVSYTQFEFLYACEQGKKTWLIAAHDGCRRDQPPEQLDIPAAADHPDPTGYQSERRRLQEAYRRQRQASSHLWHDVKDDVELQIKLRDLRDEFAELRKSFRKSQTTVLASILSILIVLGVVGFGVWWTVFRQPDTIVAKLADPEVIRSQLRKTIDATYDRELQQANVLKDWQTRSQAIDQARERREQRLSDVDKLIESVTRTLAEGNASPEYLELMRIWEEQGVDAALAYVDTQWDRLLSEADPELDDVERAKQSVRRKLSPGLESVRLLRAKGDNEAALQRCGELLAKEPTWPEARHEHVWTLIDLGDRADVYLTLTEARRHYGAAHDSAQFMHTADPSDARAQRDLSVSYNKLGEVLLQSGQVTEALAQYEKDLEISQKLAAADPSDARAQRDLSVSYNKLGDVLRQSGQVTEALAQYEKALEISQKLAAADPSDAQAQRDLYISHYKLGDVQREFFAYAEAVDQYRQGMAVLEALIAKRLDVERSERSREFLTRRIADVERRIVATGDWETVLIQPADDLPTLLYVRSRELSKQDRLDDAAQAAAKLKELDAADHENRYNAACAYALCVKAGEMGEGADLTAEQMERLEKWTGLCLTCLKEAIAAGFDDFDLMRQDEDLSAVHDLPEFKDLFPADPRKVPSSNGLDGGNGSEDAAPRPEDAATRPEDAAPRPEDAAPRPEDAAPRPEDAAP